MRGDRDLAFDEETDDIELVRARAFELDHLRAGLQQPGGGIERAFGRGVGLERQVANQQRALQAACDRGGVIGDVVDRHREGRSVAFHHHAQRIADQDQVGAAAVEDAGEHRVVGGQHRQFASVALGIRQRRHGPGLVFSNGHVHPGVGRGKRPEGAKPSRCGGRFPAFQRSGSRAIPPRSALPSARRALPRPGISMSSTRSSSGISANARSCRCGCGRRRPGTST